MKPPTDIELQKWLKALISGLSEGDVTAFAQSYDLDRSSLSLMLNGRRTISDKMVTRIIQRTKAKPPVGFEVYASNDLQQSEAAPPSGQTVPMEQFQEVLTMLKAQMRLTTSALDRLDQHSELLVKLSDRIDLLLARERNQTA